MKLAAIFIFAITVATMNAKSLPELQAECDTKRIGNFINSTDNGLQKCVEDYNLFLIYMAMVDGFDPYDYRNKTQYTLPKAEDPIQLEYFGIDKDCADDLLISSFALLNKGEFKCFGFSFFGTMLNTLYKLNGFLKDVEQRGYPDFPTDARKMLKV